MAQQTPPGSSISVIGAGALLTLPRSVWLGGGHSAPDYIGFFSGSEMAEWLEEHGYHWTIYGDLTGAQVEPVLFIHGVKAARHFIAQFGSETTIQEWTSDYFEDPNAGEWVQA